MGEKISFLSINTVQFACHQRTDRNLPEVKEDAADAAKQAGALDSDWRVATAEKSRGETLQSSAASLSLRIIHQRQAEAEAEEKSRGRERRDGRKS